MIKKDVKPYQACIPMGAEHKPLAARLRVRRMLLLGALLLLPLIVVSGCTPAVSFPTATPSPSLTPTRTATNTRTPTRTATTDPAYAEMVALVADLYEQGYIETTKGSYHRLEDHRESAALNLYLFFDPIKDDPTNFVLSGDLRWDVSTSTANTFSTGCGFIYRFQDDLNFYGVYLDINGFANAFRWVGHPNFLNNGYFGKVTVHNGTARMTVVMVEHNMTIFINEKMPIKIHDERLEYGSLGYLLASGTNQEPGTTCNWSQVAYWELP